MMNEFKLKMNGQENVLSFCNYDFKYVLKKSRYDTHHLIVVFSGYGAKSHFTYDFKESLKTNRANVLWIKDDFFDNELATYYLDPVRSGVHNDFSLEKAINLFIENTLKILGLSKVECTLLGCSKGGASALYYGIKYNFSNLVVSAPVLLVASSISGIDPVLKAPKRNAVFMLESLDNSDNRDIVDSYILDALRNDKNVSKNIYLLASKVDPRYEGHIKPYIHEFIKYSNFNYIESVSPLVVTHPDVTFHNAPLILSILGSLSFNLVPRYQQAIIGEEPLGLEQHFNKQVIQPVFDLKMLHFRGNLLFIEGIYFLRGAACIDVTDLRYRLVLESTKTKYIENLAKGRRPLISKNYYEGAFFNYEHAYFCTRRYEGLDLSHIERGEYKLFVSIKMKTGEFHRRAILSSDLNRLENEGYSDGRKFKFFVKDKNVFLVVK